MDDYYDFEWMIIMTLNDSYLKRFAGSHCRENCLQP